MTDLKFVVRLGVINPETEELQSIDIYMDAGGVMVGFDSIPIANGDRLYSPYDKKEVTLEGQEAIKQPRRESNAKKYSSLLKKL